MHNNIRQSLSVSLRIAASVSTLLFVAACSHAQNTATGTYALHSNTKGEYNTADGYYSLFSNTTGNSNTAVGYAALFNNTIASYNTALGSYALWLNSTGIDNTASGYAALYSNTTGYQNTANGTSALYGTTTGSQNTATGYYALNSNTTGWDNTADGDLSLPVDTTGGYNTASGTGSLYKNTTGSYNTADGISSLWQNTTGSYNIAVGNAAGGNITTGSNNIAIGNSGTSADSGIIRIGTAGTQKSTFVAGINGVNVGTGVDVVINANGQLGTVTSSRRFKRDIHDMGSVSDKLLQLRPVTFRYKQATENGTHPLQYGLIAEEVAKVYPDLVQYDKQGKPFTVYYHLLTPMLLSELQKEHRRNVAMHAAHNAQVAALNAKLESQSAMLQQQSAELASLKQSQQQQLKVLAKLSAFVQASQNKDSLQKAVFLQH